jgi:methyl-accepting chemotaxis protein
MQLLGDRSSLVLDPDLDSFYLVNALLMVLPRSTADVSSLAGWGTFAVLKGGIGSEAEAQWHVWSARVETGVADIRSCLARVFAANPSLKDRLDASPLEAILALRKAGKLAVFDAAPPPAADYFRQGSATLDAIGDLYARWLPVLDDVLRQRQERMEGARRLTTTVLALSLLTALYLFMSFGKVLRGGLDQVAHHIDALRSGDLTTEPQAWGSDEAARLLEALMGMQGSLRRIVTQVRVIADTVMGASADISSSAGELQAHTQQAVAGLEDTAATMEAIASTVSLSEHTAGEATQLASASAESAQRGGAVIAEVVQTMQRINTSSGRIGDIIGTIDGIAFQTNLLALNAAVEAARAGDQGRGFAVVASEVRALAQRSAAAAREIKGLIMTSVDQMDGGMRIVEQAGRTIDEMVGNAQSVRSLMQAVVSGAHEQNQGITSSAQALQRLQDLTRHNAELVQGTTEAAETLQQRARTLVAEVSRFRLPAD